VVIDEALAAALIAECFPRWAHLPVRAVLPGGHDNRTFRLGDDLSIRLPSGAGYVAAVEKEQRWLPRLANQLPLPIPAPVAHGFPAAGFPWPWSVNRWLEGESAIEATIPDPVRFAQHVAAFLRALRAADTAGAPPAGEHSFFRGGDLAVYEPEARAAIERLDDPEPARWATALLDRALRSRWDAAPVWVHGDVAAGNLLVDDGRLSAVIDFGGCAIGDPACDLVLAWTWCDATTAVAFRDAVGLDADTWDRAAGWALWKSLIGRDPAGDRTLTRLREDVP
jgi:aminoglycoside phosphotransferase (APT) family kinase protein